MRLIAGAFVIALAACAAPPPPNPVPPPEPPLVFTCAAGEATALDYAIFPLTLSGKCLRTRGLMSVETVYKGEARTPETTTYLYRNGADLAAWSGPRDHPPTFRITLIWQGGPPAGLKAYPHFIEVTGRYVHCVGKPICGYASVGIAVSGYKVLPTAMD